MSKTNLVGAAAAACSSSKTLMNPSLRKGRRASNRRVRVGLGVAAMAIGGALVEKASAVTLYVTSETGLIYQFPNAGYTGTEITASPSANSFATQTSPGPITVDPATGNVIAVNGIGAGAAYAYSPAGGASIGNSSAFGGTNWTTQLYNGVLYTSSDASGSTIVTASYSYNPVGNTATFGTPANLAVVSAENHGFGETIIPANGFGGNTDPYLLYESAFSGTNELNAYDLVTDSWALAGGGSSERTPVGNIDGMAYDAKNGLIYGVTANSSYLVQLTPTYTNGTLTGMTESQIGTVGTYPAFYPADVQFGPDGNLYFADQDADAVFEVNVDGTGTTTLDAVNEYINMNGVGAFGLAFSPTPEPSTLVLLGIAPVIGLLKRRRARSC